MSQENKELHPSQLIDGDKEFKAKVIGWIAFFPTLIGLLMVFTVPGSDAKVIGGVLALAGFIGIIFSNEIHQKSGAKDARCQKCNSNLVSLKKSEEKFAGTYSKRKRIVNSVTRQEEEISVVCTDFRVTDHWKCGLCSNGWATYRTVTSEG